MANKVMKLLILSDLHLEFASLSLSLPDCDVVILAGDIHIKGRAIEWALKNIPNRPVIYVLGNHEFYGKAYPKLIHKMKDDAKGSDIHILENDFIHIDGVNFFGCTLWTSFEIFGDPRIAGYHCQQIMNDFKKIRFSSSYSRFRSIDAAMIHKRSLLWLEEKLSDNEGKDNVVISHHSPSTQSLSDKKKGQLSSAAYASDLDDFILAHRPKLWVHGHLHRSLDYTIGDCRIVCNPRGYPDEPNEQFNEKYVITI